MLPSMPILFLRESQDGFQGNQPTTSNFGQKNPPKPALISLPDEVQQPNNNKKTEICEETKRQVKKDIEKKENPLETAFVRSYYNRVKSRFPTNQTWPSNKFVQFKNILKTFNPNKETPADLYNKVEYLFGEEHKDIVEDFLLFLKPTQAAQVGRFMDQFMLMQMANFIEMLQHTFSRKPTVLRKVLRAITTGINSGNSDVLKTRVLPHLRFNPKLIQMFKSLFPDERPPDSVYETGTDMLNEDFLTNDSGYDTWEVEGDTDNKRKVDDKQKLDTEYLHGRVFLQHRRTLRLGRVTFPYSKEPYRVHSRRLTPAHCHLSPPDSEDEHVSPKKRPRKQNNKDVNGNTKKTATGAKPRAKTAKKCRKETETKKKVENKNHAEQKGKKAERSRVVTNRVTQKVKVKSSDWTREEDKTMLEVLKGEASSELVFGKIRAHLPHRSVTDIKERFYHVMKLLQQMAIDGVT